MKNILSWVVILTVCATVLVGCVGRIETGNVGVRTEWNKKVNIDEVPQGTYVAILSSVREYVAKETALELSNQRPKAGDNLNVQDFDLSVFYRINEAKVADIIIKYSQMTVKSEDNNYYPGQGLVRRVAKGALFDVVATYDSLELHKNRGKIESKLLTDIQTKLNTSDPDTFIITNVIAKQITTDPAIEASIQAAVDMEKKVEAKENELALAEAEAARRKVEAEGEALAIKLISQSLNDRYLQYKQTLVLPEFAKVGTHTVLLPSGVQPLVNVNNPNVAQ